MSNEKITEIIFLLVIFFMGTYGQDNVINIETPLSDGKTKINKNTIKIIETKKKLHLEDVTSLYQKT